VTTQIATAGPDTNSFVDNTNGSNYYYSVRAVNANGTGANSPRVQPAAVETACTLPGITVAVDAGDAAPNSLLIEAIGVRPSILSLAHRLYAFVRPADSVRYDEAL
jgi:hypothetical protein